MNEQRRYTYVYSQSYGFSNSHVWMWELDHKEGWVPRIDAFKLWCWRRLLRVPWIARRISQSILKEINPEYSLEGSMLMLKLQYFGHLKWKADSLEKILMLGKMEDEEKETTEYEMAGWHHWLNGHEFEQALGDGEGQKGGACCSQWGGNKSDMTEQMNNKINTQHTHTHTHTHRGILLSHKNEIMPFAATWMGLEIIILSEVSNTEKDKYHLSLACGS